MNFANYERLVKRVSELGTNTFHYGSPSGENGCLACQSRLLCGQDMRVTGSPDDIKGFLGVSMEEASYLYGCTSDIDRKGGPSWDDINEYKAWMEEIKRDGGVSEAVRRLAVIAARHGYSSFKANESAFLTSIRALAEVKEEGVGV